ncbi:hypothetical protein BDN71DRAFT_1401272, partial [Pleurotus eryngii]
SFLKYGTQCGVACPGFLPTNSQGNSIFASAMSDLSPLWIGARCQSSVDANKCNGRGACNDCIGSACPDEQQYGHYFNIRCTGSLDGETEGACSGNTVKVKTIDACPATHPANYCKIAAFGGARYHSLNLGQLADTDMFATVEYQSARGLRSEWC